VKDAGKYFLSQNVRAIAIGRSIPLPHVDEYS